MKNLVLRQIMEPLLRRAGTALAAFIMGAISVDPVLVDQFVAALLSVALVSVDLVVSHYSRRSN